MMDDDRYGMANMHERHDGERESYAHAAKTGTGIAFLIVGVLLYIVTTSLVGQCRAELSILSGPGVCSGLPVYAYHLQSGLTIVAAVLGGIGVIMLVSSRQP